MILILKNLAQRPPVIDTEASKCRNRLNPGLKYFKSIFKYLSICFYFPNCVINAINVWSDWFMWLVVWVLRGRWNTLNRSEARSTTTLLKKNQPKLNIRECRQLNINYETKVSDKLISAFFWQGLKAVGWSWFGIILKSSKAHAPHRIDNKL